jgi:uncharacterized membrane protein YvbJ
MICRQCGTEIAEKALICYRCGTATSEARVKPPEGSIFDRPRRRRPPTILVVILIIIAIIVAWIFLTNRSFGSFGSLGSFDVFEAFEVNARLESFGAWLDVATSDPVL